MRVEVSMTVDEHKFSVSSWWANSPSFVVSAIEAQLKAAAAIWPELEGAFIATKKPPPEIEAPPAGTEG